MKIAIIGANGYIGRNLIDRLISETNYDIVALSNHAEEIQSTSSRLSKHNVDIFDTNTLSAYLQDCDSAYYLVHMMSQKKLDFAEAEELAVTSFCDALEGSKVKRVIYLGGLGSDNDNLSKHLKSRHKTGEILRQRLPLVIEFRASMVIGSGSISYDIVTNLIHKLPILTLPKWAHTLTQPIGLDDAISYLVASLDLSTKDHQVIEIGGPDKLSYGDLMKRYASWEHKPMLIVNLSLIPVSVAAWWLNLFTPRMHAKVGRVMVESLSNPMVVTNNKARELFPDIHPKVIEDVFV